MVRQERINSTHPLYRRYFPAQVNDTSTSLKDSSRLEIAKGVALVRGVGTPSYELYRYNVRPHRVWCFRRFGRR